MNSLLNIQKLQEMLGDPVEFGISPEDGARMNTHLEKRFDADQELANATARLFSTEDGELVLQALLRDTVLQDDAYPELLTSLSAEQVHAFSLMRKGQNSVVRMILKVIRQVEERERRD